MKKSLVPLLVAGALAGSVLTGCGGKEAAKVDESADAATETTEMSPAEAYEAYKEFYREFYDEHGDSDSDYSEFDCGAQIVFDADHKPLLAVCDVTGIRDDEYLIVDVYLYEYENGTVKELAKKSNMEADDDGVYIAAVNGAITMFCVADEGEGIYTLDGDSFQKEEVSNDNIYENLYGKYWDEVIDSIGYEVIASTSDYVLPAYSDFFSEVEPYAIAGSDFERLLDSLAEADVENEWKLKLAYADFLKTEGFWDESAFHYVKDGCLYIYDTAGECFYYLSALSDKDFPSGEDYDKADAKLQLEKISSMPDKINGRDVKVSAGTINEILSYADISQFEKIGLEDDTIAIDFAGGASIELSASYQDDEGNLNDVLWTAAVGSDGTTFDITYEQFKKYFDGGLAADIEFEGHKDGLSAFSLERISVTVPDMEAYESMLEGEEKEKLLMEQEVLPAYEKYVNDNFDVNGCSVYNLIYIDEDNIPELLFDNSGDGRGTEVLSYQDGSVYSSSAWSRGDFDYIPSRNRVVYGGVYLGNYYYTLAHLENGVLVVEHSCETCFDADINAVKYYIDGAICSEEEYNNFKNKLFQYDDMEYGWKTSYYTIQEAYESLGKETYTAYSDSITRFEIVDNVLTIETEDGNNLSCPVSENCAWEEAGVGNPIEFYGTTTYEEVKDLVDSVRAYAVKYQEYDSPPEICVEMKDDVVVRVYTLSS